MIYNQYLMNPTEFWQNFKMREEQEIACNFVFDALRNLHEMESLSLETEIFPVLYNLSVGLERLFKVAIVLLEVDETTNVEEFARSLITHNHIVLLDRIKKKSPLSFGPAQTGLLNLLAVFYEDHRYGRFDIAQRDNLSKDKKLFHTYLQKYLNIDTTDDDLLAIENTAQVKKFMGKTVKKITKDLYSLIDKAATAKNLYTCEISGSWSKAAKVVWGNEEITFEEEEIVMMEVLIYLLKTTESTRINLLKEIEPLPLDPALDGEYLHFMIRKQTGFLSAIMGEVEDKQADSKNQKDRLEMIKAIKDPRLEFVNPEDTEI